MPPVKFGSIWPCSFRSDMFSSNQKQELLMAAMFVDGSGLNEQSLLRALFRCLLSSLVPFGLAVSTEMRFL